MKYHSIIIILLATIGLFSTDRLLAGTGTLSEQRMNRWRENSVLSQNNNPANLYLPPTVLALPAEGMFGDLKVNSDNSAATFNQRNCDIAHFSDGRGVIVWEDERSGLWRIAAQPIDLSGAAVGTNRFLDSGNPPSTLRQPKVTANASGVVVIIYVKQNDNGLYGRAYDFSMGSGGTEFRIDDATPGNLVNQPDIAQLSGNRFVVVWEDSRNGSNIYAQILNSNGTPSGGNFQINASLVSPYRIAPAVVSTLAGDFAVVWEDGRSGNGDVYFRIFTDVGTPLFPELLLDAPFASDYQFMPEVEFLKGSGYLTIWISNRNSGQSVYAQLISTSSVPIGSSFRINDADTDVCWDINTESAADSGAVCTWAEYSTSASIEVQKISKTGTISGGNVKLEGGGLLRERSFPAIAKSATGFTAVWVDQRNENLDIFAQRLSSSISKVNTNYKINDDTGGAQQLTPDIAGIAANSLGIVWHDRKTDQGDITLQMLNSAGNPQGVSIKVNDDNGSAIQKTPRIGASASGLIWTVWEDARTDGSLQGQNIMAQRFNGAGVPQGANLVVNGDGTSRPKSNPDLDVAADGKVFFAWVDERDDSRQVYVQSYSSTGAALGANIKISSLPVGTENLEPHVGVRNDGSFVVAWLSIIGGRQVAYFQQYSHLNVPVGAARMLEVDTANVQVLDLDICVHHADRRFYLSTVERENSEVNVKMYGYDPIGNPTTAAVTVSDIPGDYSEVRIATDVSDAILITWQSNSGVGSRGMIQIMRNDGFALGSNQLMSLSLTNHVEISPVATMIGGYYYSVWADNRDANAGFDIYVNSLQYTSTDAEEENDVILPSGFTLCQNYPNPFNPETVISYSLDRPADVTLTIYNILGQECGRLVNKLQSAGSYEVRWNSSDGENTVASGIYFYRLTVGDKSVTRKMTLLK